MNSITEFPYLLLNDLRSGKNIEIEHDGQPVENDSSKNSMGKEKDIIAEKVDEHADDHKPQYIRAEYPEKTGYINRQLFNDIIERKEPEKSRERHEFDDA
jgi:hypothetical protein